MTTLLSESNTVLRPLILIPCSKMAIVTDTGDIPFYLQQNRFDLGYNLMQDILFRYK
jgi:hypothetical protein